MCAEDKSLSFLSVYISNQIFWNTLYTFYFTVEIWCGASADKKGSTMLQSVRRSQSINRVALKTKFFCGELPVHPPGQRFPVAREGRPLIRNPLDQLQPAGAQNPDTGGQETIRPGPVRQVCLFIGGASFGCVLSLNPRPLSIPALHPAPA